MFGEPGEHLTVGPFADVKIDTISTDLVDAMVHSFSFEILPDADLS